MAGPNMFGFILYVLSVMFCFYFGYEYKVLAQRAVDCKIRQRKQTKALIKFCISAIVVFVVIGFNIFYFNRI